MLFRHGKVRDAVRRYVDRPRELRLLRRGLRHRGDLPRRRLRARVRRRRDKLFGAMHGHLERPRSLRALRGAVRSGRGVQQGRMRGRLRRGVDQLRRFLRRPAIEQEPLRHLREGV